MKSPLDLVAAFAIARTQLLPEIDLHLTIVGDGPLRDAVNKAVDDAKLRESVHIVGAVGQERVRELLHKAHIYTQHCRVTEDGQREGQGVSFVEASAAGLPIVTTRSGGIVDVVLDGKTGYLVEEGDVVGMAERIVELARNPARWTELGRAGCQHVQANFALEHQLSKTLGLFQMLLDSHAAISRALLAA